MIKLKIKKKIKIKSKMDKWDKVQNMKKKKKNMDQNEMELLRDQAIEKKLKKQLWAINK